MMSMQHTDAKLRQYAAPCELGSEQTWHMRTGSTVETCDLMTLAGSLPFQSAAVWRELSRLIVSSQVRYHNYVVFETNVTV